MKTIPLHQCSHATLGCFQKACERIPKSVDTWFYGGQGKVVCKCDSDDDMYAEDRGYSHTSNYEDCLFSREQLRVQAKFNGLTTCLIRDAGRAQLGAGSRTVLGIGPGEFRNVPLVIWHSDRSNINGMLLF